MPHGVVLLGLRQQNVGNQPLHVVRNCRICPSLDSLLLTIFWTFVNARPSGAWQGFCGVFNRARAAAGACR